MKQFGQRELLEILFSKFGADRDDIVEAYAQADRDGEVVRKSNVNGVSSEAYAKYVFSWWNGKGLFGDAFNDRKHASAGRRSKKRRPVLRTLPARGFIKDEGLGIVDYSRSRLTFLARVIEPLDWEERFRVGTPFGVYEFTKREFYDRFPKIVRTRSYLQDGSYHGALLHLQAEAFRVDGL